MKIIISTIVLGIFLVSCGSNDPQAKLRELEAQRDDINAQIKELKNEIVKNNGNSENGRISYVKLQKVTPTLFKHFIKIQGTIESDNNILVPPQSAGIVKKICVEKGDKVQKGQLLAELDGAIYESNMQELKTSLALATTVYERQERLWKKKIGSEIQYLQAKAAKEGLEQRLTSVNEQYKLTKIISPISGTIDQIIIKEGEMASPQFGAIRVVQLSDLKIKADLSEQYISALKVGDLVDVNIPVLNRILKLKINAVSQVIDPKNRTISIEIIIPKSESDMKPNMLAVLTINDYENLTALTVPLDVLQKTGEEMFLFTAKEHPDNPNEKWVVEKRFVKTGYYYDEVVEVLDGIKENEQVVVFGFQNLADGQTVQLGNE